MGKGAVKLPLDGLELLDIINSANTKSVALGSLSDIADYINSLGIPAEIIMISLLQDMNAKLCTLEEIKDELKKQTKLLEKIYDQ